MRHEKYFLATSNIRKLTFYCNNSKRTERLARVSIALLQRLGYCLAVVDMWIEPGRVSIVGRFSPAGLRRIQHLSCNNEFMTVSPSGIV